MQSLPTWTRGVHHDGSALYVSNLLPALNETITLTIQVPQDAPIETVFIQNTPDGERAFHPMERIETTETYQLWAGQIVLSMPIMTYHFRLVTNKGVYHYTPFDISRAEHPEWMRFKLIADYQAPTWVYETVFYQIFPDRFANGKPELTTPEGAWEAMGYKTTQVDWDEPPAPWEEKGNLDFYGGDLIGIQQRLDYLTDLGINGIYMTPIFTSESNHRYDIKDLHNVDPHLGGNEALIDLRQAMTDQNMRLMLDVTPNHVSWHHPWFKDAQKNPNADSAEYFTFYDDTHQAYEKWLGVPILPKLNYRSQKLRDAMYRDQDSVIRQWLAAPYNIDGWRLDVFNMTARQGKDQLLHEVGRELRDAVKHDKPDAYILAEHWFDASPHLQGDEMDATMNYQGFNIPVWRWLAGAESHHDNPHYDAHRIPAEVMAEQWQIYLGSVPWVIALQQFNQLSSHDTARILSTVNDDKALVKLSMVLLMTYVGVPCIYYGDEIGLAGEGDPTNRGAFPWDDNQWDSDLRDFVKTLIQLRRDLPTLQQGGYQLLHADGDLIAFQRHDADQQVIIIAYVGDETITNVKIPVWHGGIADGTPLMDRLSNTQITVQNGAISCSSLAHGQAMILQAQ